MNSDSENNCVSSMTINGNSRTNIRRENQQRRMYGKKYQGYLKGILRDREPRKIGEACKSKFCERSSLRHCSFFSDDKRKNIFNKFWKMSWEEKKICINGLVEFSRRKRVCSDDSRRSRTKLYYLSFNSVRKQVCSKMFLSTLGVTETMVRKWTDEVSDLETKKRTSKQRLSKNQYKIRVDFLKTWLESVPKIESHYRRKYTKKIYFQVDFSSYRQIFSLYLQECKSNEENEVFPVSFPNFMNILKEGNYSLFKPRNDQCDICLEFKEKNLSRDCFNKHRTEIEQMKIEKENDIENAKAGLCLLFCIDMQAVKLIPQLKANSWYYKMKLQIHNFTVYNIISHDSDNYVWDETEGSLVASTFATCIVNHLKNALAKSPDSHHIIIYSDSCCYQNKNVVLSNALLLLCMEKNITIEHKYLIVGHTQMECDSTHSLIERKIKNKQINLPSQFADLIQSARLRPTPLNVHMLTHEYFLDYENIPKIYSSIRPGKKSGDPTVNMIRALAYDPSGIIYYKTSITEEYEQLPQIVKEKTVTLKPPRLHLQRLEISEKKWQHLQDLKSFIPKDCHSFYNNIPFKTTC